MKKIKIYLAGPLFIQSEIDQRKAEAKKLRELGYEVYSPIEQNEDIGFDLDEEPIEMNGVEYGDYDEMRYPKVSLGESDVIQKNADVNFRSITPTPPVFGTPPTHASRGAIPACFCRTRRNS